MTTTNAAALLPGRWRADIKGSEATFTVTNLGRTAHGRVPIVAGTVEIGQDGRPAAVHGTLDLGAIDTGNTRRDLDLRKPRLLDLDNHPSMTFTGTFDGAEVTGELTARGATASLTGQVEVSIADTQSAVLTARARLDRSALGIRAPRFMIGRWVDITIVATISPDRA
jgi:polyisoprenoid-binding protein YceI